MDRCHVLRNSQISQQEVNRKVKNSKQNMWSLFAPCWESKQIRGIPRYTVKLNCRWHLSDIQYISAILFFGKNVFFISLFIPQDLFSLATHCKRLKVFLISSKSHVFSELYSGGNAQTRRAFRWETKMCILCVCLLEDKK